MKAKYILAAVFSAALLSSCSDFLDVQKEGDPTTTQYFTNDNQAIDAIDALYRPIHQEVSSVAKSIGSRVVRATSFGVVRAATTPSPRSSTQVTSRLLKVHTSV